MGNPFCRLLRGFLSYTVEPPLTANSLTAAFFRLMVQTLTHSLSFLQRQRPVNLTTDEHCMQKPNFHWKQS